MRRALPIWAGIVALLGIIAAPTLADEDAVKKLFVAYLKAVGEADTAAMGPHYADEVIVISRSTILNKKYGLAEGGAKDKKVAKDQLLKAYAKMIEAFDKKEWVARYGKLTEQQLEYVTVTVKLLKSGEIKLGFLKPGDVMAFVVSEGEAMVMIYRKSENGSWTIIADHWEQAPNK